MNLPTASQRHIDAAGEGRDGGKAVRRKAPCPRALQSSQTKEQKLKVSSIECLLVPLRVRPTIEKFESNKNKQNTELFCSPEYVEIPKIYVFVDEPFPPQLIG